jgi:ParB family chromosome partitioning protein
MSKKNKPVDVKRQAQLSALRSSLQAERSTVATQPSPIEARFARADALVGAGQGSQPPTPVATSTSTLSSSRNEEIVGLNDIIARQSDLRVLRPSHVKDLAASIATVGLIQPPAVDAKGRLLAGEHRRAALALLRAVSGSVEAVAEEWSELEPEDHARIAAGWKHHGFDKGVPVRRMPFDAEEDRGLALAVEATENEKRTDFSKEEVREVVEKLKAAGFRATVGRPKKGEKALSPQLAIIFGKSQRQVFNYLAELRGDTDDTPKPPPKPKPADPLAEQLQALFGMPVVIKREKNGQGRVTLSFSSEAQLRALVERTVTGLSQPS